MSEETAKDQSKCSCRQKDTFSLKGKRLNKKLIYQCKQTPQFLQVRE